MSKVSNNYSELASYLGMSYDSVNDVIYGQKDSFDLILYAADSRYPYMLTVHTSAKTPTGVALAKEDFKELGKSTKALGVGKQDGNNIIVPLMNYPKQEKLKEGVKEGISALLSFLRGRGLTPCCCICGQTEEIAAYKAGGSYYHLCPNCETNMRGNLALTTQKKEQKKENIVGGIVGALLGSLVGVLCIIVLSRLGYVAALSGAVMAIGVLKGYELLGGKLTTKGTVISIIIMLVMTYVGDRLDWAIVLMGEGGGADAGYNLFDCYRLVSYALQMEMIEMTAYIGNLVLLYVFLLLGAVPTIMSKVKEKKEEGRMVKIGSAAGYGSYVS